MSSGTCLALIGVTRGCGSVLCETILLIEKVNATLRSFCSQTQT